MNKSLYQRLLDNQTTAVVLMDARLQIEYLNSAAEALLATSSARACQHRLSDILASENCVFQALEKSLASDQSYARHEAELQLLTGENFKVDYTITPLPDSPPRLILELYPRDRWQRISREENLLWQQDASRMLIRGFAHEIKNPLGGIRGAAQLLARELPDEQLHEYTNIIIEEADRLRNLVDQMLGPYRPTVFTWVNIHEVLERVVGLIQSESDITIIRDYDPSIPEIKGNKEQLIQAVLNIARNAMQAIKNSSQSQPGVIRLVTRAQRQVTIGSKRHRAVCQVNIIDNGPGIAEEVRETIFYPMVSGNTTGSGLGLTIAQHILSQHGGLIEAQSEPGTTCFSLTIPLNTTKGGQGDVT